MYKWLRGKFEGRSVAEMSIAHTLFGIGSFLMTIFFCFCIASDSPVFFLVAFSLWAIFLIWLWIGLVKTAWRSGQERLGLPIFRFLQIGIIVMFAITILPTCRQFEDLKFLFYMIFAFDIAIAWLVVNFLFLAWFARCKIPLHAYFEIGSTIAMVILQIYLLN